MKNSSLLSVCVCLIRFKVSRVGTPFVLSCSQDTYVENLKTSNIQYTNKVLTLLFGVQGVVTLLDQEFEETIEHTLTQGTDRVGDLILVTTLCDEFSTDLDTWLKQALVQLGAIDSEQLGDFLTGLSTIGFSLLFATTLLESHGTHMHDSGSDLVDIFLLLLGETQDVKGLLF